MWISAWRSGFTDRPTGAKCEDTDADQGPGKYHERCGQLRAGGAVALFTRGRSTAGAYRENPSFTVRSVPLDKDDVGDD